MKIRERKTTILIILIILTGFGVLAWWLLRGGSQKLVYTAAEVKKGTLIVSVSGSGSIIAGNIAEIDPGISGEVVAVNVSEGDEVQKDQLLLKIKNDNLEADRAKAYVTYLQAKESLEKAKLDRLSAQEELDELREEKNEDPDSVSDLQIQIAEQKIRGADLAIQSAENKVWQASLDYQTAKDKADKRGVKASIAGTVVALNAEVGDQLGEATGSNASDTSKSSSILTIIDLNNLEAQIDVNEIDAPKVKKDQKATLAFDAFAEGKKFTGKVTHVDVLGTTTQGVTTYKVEIALDSVEPAIKPGMTVSASIIIERKENVLLVPNTAIKQRGEQIFVQILSEKGLPEDVEVGVGLSSDQETEVISGLDEGDRVITGTVSQAGQQPAFGSQGGMRGIMPGGFGR